MSTIQSLLRSPATDFGAVASSDARRGYSRGHGAKAERHPATAIVVIASPTLHRIAASAQAPRSTTRRASRSWCNGHEVAAMISAPVVNCSRSPRPHPAPCEDAAHPPQDTARSRCRPGTPTVCSISNYCPRSTSRYSHRRSQGLTWKTDGAAQPSRDRPEAPLADSAADRHRPPPAAGGVPRSLDTCRNAARARRRTGETTSSPGAARGMIREPFRARRHPALTQLQRFQDRDAERVVTSTGADGVVTLEDILRRSRGFARSAAEERGLRSSPRHLHGGAHDAAELNRSWAPLSLDGPKTVERAILEYRQTSPAHTRGISRPPPRLGRPTIAWFQAGPLRRPRAQSDVPLPKATRKVHHLPHKRVNCWVIRIRG